MERLTFRHDCPYSKFHGRAESCEPIHCIDEHSVKARNAVVDRLAAYEDTGLTPEQINGLCEMDRRARMSDLLRLEEYQALGTVEELTALVKARGEGRLVVLPEVSERDKQGMADYLHDCFAEWTHDPSVGLYGMTEGEAKLADAITAALARAEAEAALSGGKEEQNDG